MHLQPVFYEDFSFCGDMVYEISKNMILEKIIYLSICYFTIATEMRFMEMEKIKAKKGILNNDKKIELDPKSEIFLKSELFHLKSIEIVCKFITCKSPFVNHLIASY